MGDVDIQKIPPLKIKELTGVEALRISQFTGVEPLRIGQIAPAAVHIKELNHIDPISVESLRIDQVRNLDPVRVERFDVTHLPTVDVSLSRFPAMDVSIRRMPPIAVAMQQEFSLASQYRVHARLLGVEILRLDVHGETTVRPRDCARRERTRTHERSYLEVAAAGNPAIPVKRTETRTIVRHHAAEAPERPSHGARAAAAGALARVLGAAADALSAGRPRFSYSATPPPAPHSAPDIEGSVSSGGE